MTLAARYLVFYPTLIQSLGMVFPVNIAGLITFPRGVFAGGAATTTLLCKNISINVSYCSWG